MAIRIGILGAAKIAPPVVINPSRDNPDFEVVAVAARDPQRAKAYAAEHKIPNVAKDYDALVRRDDVDLVYNALPPGGHARWTIAALQAGKHVLCEKPFAMNAAQVKRMNEAAAKSGRKLVEAFHYRHHNVMKRAVEIARSGELGKVVRVDADFLGAHPVSRRRVALDARTGRRRADGSRLLSDACAALGDGRRAKSPERQLRAGTRRRRHDATPNSISPACRRRSPVR